LPRATPQASWNAHNLLARSLATVDDVPKDILDDIKVTLINAIDDVLPLVLGKSEFGGRSMIAAQQE
jgi:hypothetical protein